MEKQDAARIKKEILADVREQYPFASDVGETFRYLTANRRVLIWGACERSRDIIQWLDRLNIKYEGFIDSNPEIILYEGKRVLRPAEINKNDFIFLALLNRHAEIDALLMEAGLVESRDYLYPFRRNIAITDLNDSYMDYYGNEITGSVKAFKVIMQGCGNKIFIGKGCEIDPSVVIKAEGDCTIILEDHVRVKHNTPLWASDSSLLWIGKNSRIGDGSQLMSRYDSVIKLSDGVSISGALMLSTVQKSLCYIGKDCMFSTHVAIQCSDAHNIFDLTGNKNMNIRKNYSVFIREHVWIGRRANILYGADIGSGSIVGLGAFVNKTFPGNAVIAGNPARIVNENVAWNGRPDEFLDDYEDFRRYDYRDLQE